MTIQSEAGLENNLINQLESEGYERVIIKDESDLERNFKKQLQFSGSIKEYWIFFGKNNSADHVDHLDSKETLGLAWCGPHPRGLGWRHGYASGSYRFSITQASPVNPFAILKATFVLPPQAESSLGCEAHTHWLSTAVPL